MASPELDDDHVVAICSVLAEHGVEFVVIGGVAARLHDTGHATVDIDVCPSRRADNLRRLSAALTELGTRLRVEGEPDGVEFEPHPDLLVNMTTMTLLTRHGPLDLYFEPAGFSGGYDDLAPRLVVVRRDGVDIPLASLEDVIVSKQRAGRPKDVAALPALEAPFGDVTPSSDGRHRSRVNRRALVTHLSPQHEATPTYESRREARSGG